MKIQNWSTPVKRLIGVLLSLFALNYLFFLSTIWVDTSFKLSLIEEAYSDMSLFELMRHSYEYLQWFLVVFSLILFLFWQTDASAKAKYNASLWTILWIILDIGSVWGITYHLIFAKILYLSGLVLAATFFLLWMSIQKQLWSQTCVKS